MEAWGSSHSPEVVGGGGSNAVGRNVSFAKAGGGSESSSRGGGNIGGGASSSGSDRDGALPQPSRSMMASPRPQQLFTIGESTVESTTSFGNIPSPIDHLLLLSPYIIYYNTSRVVLC